MPRAADPRALPRILSFLAVAIALAAPSATGLGLLPIRETWEPALLDASRFVDATTAYPLEAPLPADASGIGPGALILSTIEGVDYMCTANWIWQSGSAYYLGAAGHCFLPADRISTHGPGHDFDASGVAVRVCVAQCEFGGQLGFLLTGQTVDLGQVGYARQIDGEFAIGNDFGVVRIPSALLPLVRTSVPVWGQTSGAAELQTGDVTCHYGHATGFGEVFATKARTGVGILTMEDGSWRAAIPSFQGDSGAAIATCAPDAEGAHAVAAIGLLTHLSGTGVAGTTMARAQQMATEAGLSLTPLV